MLSENLSFDSEHARRNLPRALTFKRSTIAEDNKNKTFRFSRWPLFFIGGLFVSNDTARTLQLARRTFRLSLCLFSTLKRERDRGDRTVWFCLLNDPQPGVVRESDPWTAMCVRNVDVHVSCSSQVDAQLAAFFIDPRAK